MAFSDATAAKHAIPFDPYNGILSMRETARRIAILTTGIVISATLGAALGWGIGKYLAWWRESNR